MSNLNKKNTKATDAEQPTTAQGGAAVTKEPKGLDISAKSFIVAIVVLLVLMIGTYILTLVVPAGEYLINGSDYSFSYVEGGIPFWKWILSPILVLGAEGSTTIIAILAFLLIIGGIFNSLNKSGLMNYMVDRIIARFGDSRYKLMAALIGFFMAMGAFVGSFEEAIPLVPIIVTLAIGLGWDKETGLGMSIIAVGCGFAAGVANPFTVGVAQKLAGLPMFSGLWFRLLSGLCIYALLYVFVSRHAKKIEKPMNAVTLEGVSEKDPTMDKAMKCFAITMGIGILAVISSGFISALQDYSMVIVVLMFLVAGISSTHIAGMKGKVLGKTFLDGLISILPAVIMILMASSIKYTLEEGQVLDTLLYYAVGLMEGMPKAAIILIVYAVALILNFFVSSGSAEAMLLIPLVVPVAKIYGLSSQLCVLAFAYGDGFSNVLYPTNAALLISLGLVDMGYGRYVKWSWKFQALNLVLTSCLLLVGLAIGY